MPEAAPIVDERECEAKVNQQFGNEATGNGEYEKAIQYYQNAHEIFPDIEADEIEVTAYQWLSYNLLQGGQYQESIKHYRDVVKFTTQLGDKRRKLNAYLGLGCAFNNIGDYESSRKYYIQALTIAEFLEDKRSERDVHTNLGNLYYKHSMFQAALQSYLKATEIFNDLDGNQGKVNVCLMIGHSFRQLEQHEKAIEYYEAALNIDEETNGERETVIQRNQYEKSLEGIVNEWCGYCCSFISEEEAIRFYKRAKDIAKRDGAKYTEYRTNKAIGKIFFGSDDFEQAKNYYRQSLVNAMELHDKHCEGTSCLDLASVASEESDYETGREWYEKALYIGTEHDNQILKEKARTGLNIVNSILAKPRNATKRIESTQKVEKMETDKGMYVVCMFTLFTGKNKFHPPPS
jgi:tetratricopeptide (TPR) repeat protein